MSTDLARHAAQLPAADEWRTMLQMAEVFIQSGLLPSGIKTPAAAVTIIAKGRELGIPPLYALSKISIIEGKPACEAELMLAMIYRDHGDGAVVPVESDATRCTMKYKRRGWPEYRTHTFTIEEAGRAKLTGKQVWQHYPPAMLRARCISALARIGFPDSLGGMYTPEELGARVVLNEQGEIVLDDEPPTVDRPRQAASTTAPASTERTQLEQREVEELLEGLEHDYEDATGKADLLALLDGRAAFWGHLTGDEQADIKRWETAAVARLKARPAAAPEPEPVPA